MNSFLPMAAVLSLLKVPFLLELLLGSFQLSSIGPGTGTSVSISVFSSCNWSFQGKSLGRCGSIQNLGLGICSQYASLAIRNSIAQKKMCSPWPNQEEETKRSSGEGSGAMTASSSPSQTILVKVGSGWSLSQFQLCEVVQALLS